MPLAALGHHWEQAGELTLARDRYRAAAAEAEARFAHAESEDLYRAFLRLGAGVARAEIVHTPPRASDLVEVQLA